MYNPPTDSRDDDWFAQNDPSRQPPVPSATTGTRPTPSTAGGATTPPSGINPQSGFAFGSPEDSAFYGTSGASQTRNGMDPAYVKSRVYWLSTLPGANPSLKNDPDYWVKQILANGGWKSDGTTEIDPYWQKKALQPEGSGAGDSLIAPFTESFNAPKPIDLGGPGGLPITPTFTPPEFQAPTAQSVLSDPGYQFRLGQGEQALQQSAAGQGLLNTGGTLKDVLKYGQNFASNEFQNVWNRNMDVYNTAFQGAAAAFAPKMAGYQTQATQIPLLNQNNYMNAYSKWLQDYNIFRNQQLDTFNKQHTVATE